MFSDIVQKHLSSSLPGLTRQSIALAKSNVRADAQLMDARVKPGHDERRVGARGGER
jgi:hypothetical protein